MLRPFVLGAILLAGLSGAGCSTTSGGPDGSAGSGGSGGAGGATCAGAMLEFRLEAAQPDAWFTRDSAQGCAPASWLSIFDAAGSAVPIAYPTQHCCNLADCDSCSFASVVCQTGWMQKALPLQRTWDGTMFPPGHCGAVSTACVFGQTCAPAGSYTAHLCASRLAGEEMACVDVPFSLPPSGPVVGTLAP